MYPMPKVKIIADSTCDLSRELLERYDVAVVPLYVTLGGQSYRDGVDMTVDQLFAHCDSTHEVPKTAASSVSDFIEAFRPFCEAGQDIVFLGISGHFSVQIQNALLAAQEFPERTIRCVDSQNLSTGIGLLVIEAAERAQAGMGANEIADAVEALRPKVNAGFVLDTLTYLRRGGRCSGLAALGAAMLNIKPQISVIDGKMAPTDKFRGHIRRVTQRYVDKQLADIERIRPRRVFLTHCCWPQDWLEEICEHVRARGYFEEVLTTSAGCVISSHCGPNCIGILFMEK